VRQSLAMGLFRALNDPAANSDLAGRDALLAELRRPTNAYPADAVVREQLAMVMPRPKTTGLRAMDGRRNCVDGPGALANSGFNLVPRAILMIEVVHEGQPEDAAVRMLLPMSLVHAMKANDVARRNALLDQLRLLAEADPEDNRVGAVPFEQAARSKPR